MPGKKNDLFEDLQSGEQKYTIDIDPIKTNLTDEELEDHGKYQTMNDSNSEEQSDNAQQKVEPKPQKLGFFAKIFSGNTLREDLLTGKDVNRPGYESSEKTEEYSDTSSESDPNSGYELMEDDEETSKVISSPATQPKKESITDKLFGLFSSNKSDLHQAILDENDENKSNNSSSNNRGGPS